jgi:hypothetical protein
MCGENFLLRRKETAVWSSGAEKALSRIWDALKKAQQQKADREAGVLVPTVERRRSPRLTVDVPLFVYGHNGSEEPFYEETKTIEINGHGGLLLLGASVQPGQKLLLTNKLTHREIECRVVRLGPAHPYKTDVAVAFSNPAPEFWRLVP